MNIEKNFCIYCKKELKPRSKYKNQYHKECLKEMTKYKSTKQTINLKDSILFVEEAQIINELEENKISCSFETNNYCVTELKCSIKQDNVDLNSICGLTNLKSLVLDVDYNQPLYSLHLPKKIENLTKLTEFTAINCLLNRSIELLRLLPNLEKVNFSGNSFENIPEILTEIRNLKSLNILNNKNILFMPFILYEMTSLESLQFSKDSLDSLKKEISNLPRLTSLKLSSNFISTIPKEVGSLKNLKELDFDDNFIQIVPDEIFDLPNLEFLGLRGNPIKSLSKRAMDLKKLKEIHIDLKNLNSESILIINELKEKGIQISESGLTIYV